MAGTGQEVKGHGLTERNAQMQVIKRDYQGLSITLQDDGWFNATQVAESFSRRVDHWLKSQETNDYIAALCEMTNTPKKGYLKTKRGVGGGTWLHPKLAVHFARWLDPKFAVWCDVQIDNLIRGKDDWKKLRHEAASSYKVMSSILQMTRQDCGKDTAPHHFSNEARLVNFVLSGEFKGIDRDSLETEDLALLAYLEERNAVLIGRGFSYESRKQMLKSYAMDWRMSRTALALAKGQIPQGDIEHG